MMAVRNEGTTASKVVGSCPDGFSHGWPDDSARKSHGGVDIPPSMLSRKSPLRKKSILTEIAVIGSTSAILLDIRILRTRGIYEEKGTFSLSQQSKRSSNDGGELIRIIAMETFQYRSTCSYSYLRKARNSSDMSFTLIMSSSMLVLRMQRGCDGVFR